MTQGSALTALSTLSLQLGFAIDCAEPHLESLRLQMTSKHIQIASHLSKQKQLRKYLVTQGSALTALSTHSLQLGFIIDCAEPQLESLTLQMTSTHIQIVI